MVDDVEAQVTDLAAEAASVDRAGDLAEDPRSFAIQLNSGTSGFIPRSCRRARAL
jgi:hypothetical protein